MTARTHPGSVIHCWDHLVITLRGDDGATTAFLSLYAIAYSATLGAGHVAYVEVADVAGVPWRATLTDDLELGRRQGERLAAMGETRMRDAGPPRLARFEREPYDETGFGFRILTDDTVIHARWVDPAPPFWSDGQDGGFSDTEDLWAMFVGAPRAVITIDGAFAAGSPFEDDVWVPSLGRSLSSAHAAFAEVRVTPVSDRARGTAPA